MILKTEPDGRMFPITDDSQTIIDCLMNEAAKRGVVIKTKTHVRSINRSENGFEVDTDSGKIPCTKLILATGSHPLGYQLTQSFGHTLIPSVPSLFTFNIPQSPFLELSGISIEPVRVSIEGTSLSQTGPLLFTHWDSAALLS